MNGHGEQEQRRRTFGPPEIAYPTGGEFFFGSVYIVFYGDPGPYCIYFQSDDGNAGPYPVSIASDEDNFSGWVPPISPFRRRPGVLRFESTQITVCQCDGGPCPDDPGDNCSEPVEITTLGVLDESDQIHKGASMRPSIKFMKPYIHIVTPGPGDQHAFAHEIPVVFLAYAVRETFNATHVAVVLTNESSGAELARQEIALRDDTILYHARLTVGGQVNPDDDVAISLTMTVRTTGGADEVVSINRRAIQVQPQ